MRLQLKSRLGRLEHAASVTSAHKPFKLRLGHLKQLPRDYTGARHLEIVKRMPPRSPIGKWVEFEERPGAAPAGSFTERVINVCFVGEEEG
jgi:hypothetical protein